VQDFNGKTAVIAGAGSGIGRASALALAAESANIVAVDLDAARAEAAAEAVRALGRKAVAVACDVTSDADLARVRAAALAAFGRIDILMNNVGYIVRAAFADMAPEHWRKTFEVNVLAAVRAVQLMLPDLQANGEGHIVNVASTAALYPYNTDRMPYNATKLALFSFSEALWMELKPKNVGVTLLLPGPVMTNIGASIVTLTPDLPLGAPDLPLLQPDVVGPMVVQAVRDGAFFVPTHPEVRAIFAEHARDPDVFLAAAERKLVR
jgi:NAD(P)-dependent dehydrogenase (short-subunit alcohol dehydrogenase family)